MPSQVDDTLSFAERLKRLMREQRIGNEGMFVRTGISPRLVAKYRAGTTEPRDAFGDPTANAHKLAAALGVEVSELLPPREPNGQDTPVAA